jgi:hypothetical protein
MGDFRAKHSDWQYQYPFCIAMPFQSTMVMVQNNFRLLHRSAFHDLFQKTASNSTWQILERALAGIRRGETQIKALTRDLSALRYFRAYHFPDGIKADVELGRAFYQRLRGRFDILAERQPETTPTDRVFSKQKGNTVVTPVQKSLAPTYYVKQKKQAQRDIAEAAAVTKNSHVKTIRGQRLNRVSNSKRHEIRAC